MGAIVVDDGMDHLADRDRAFDGIKEADELPMGVLGRAVAGNGVNPAVVSKPFGQRRGAPVRQQVDNATPLQVDENGPVGLAPAQ